MLQKRLGYLRNSEADQAASPSRRHPVLPWTQVYGYGLVGPPQSPVDFTANGVPSQMRPVPSTPPVARKRPSWLQARVFTAPEWPASRNT